MKVDFKTDLITDFSHPQFREAFKQYFKELEVEFEDYDSLFKEMTDEGGNEAIVAMASPSEIIGFIQFKADKLSNWFFEENIGFIREFWICPKFRKNGFGASLLRQAETRFFEQGLRKVVLTSDTAPLFYLKQGYHQDTSYKPINKIEVFVKLLDA